MKTMKIAALLLSFFVPFTSFAQQAGANSAAPSTNQSAAASTAPPDQTRFEVADEKVTAMCRDLVAAGTAEDRKSALKALGKFHVHCLKLVGQTGAKIPAKPSQETGNAAAFRALGDENGKLKAALEAATSKCDAHYISVVNGFITQGPCIGAADVVFKTTVNAPAPAPRVAPVVHDLGTVGAAQPQTPSGGAGNHICNLMYNGKVVETVKTTDDPACKAWTSKQAADRGWVPAK